ncbi:MAG: M23 family metallopeptidase [Verrucomicrobiales bacterium]|nr:M23 family metallopeptidase [Verrucomicrobiales bacterium]MED5586239.1 M23 family metallopeptidase [Verrucomicrobiota bacterium]
MSTFHRRNGRVKYVPPRRFLDGLRLSVAVPAAVFAVLLVVVVAISLNKVPVAEKWVILKDYKAWRPYVDTQGNAVVPDSRFCFVRPIDAARTPRVTRFDSPIGSEHGALTYNAQPFMAFNRHFGSYHLADDLNGIGGGDTDLGDLVYSVAAGRVVYAAHASDDWGNVVIIEHASGSGIGRRLFQTVYAHLDSVNTAVGMLVKRGEAIGTIGGAQGRYPAHLHFEVRDTDVADPGTGYAAGKLNRRNPEKMIIEMRGAPAELLNRSPRIREGEGDMPFLDFDGSGDAPG